MKFTYLGTAAAEGWPAVFCNCEHCLRARKAGGRNIRTRPQALVNDDLLIDFNGDTYSHVLKNNLDLSRVKNCIVTHSHEDHFVPVDLFFRGTGYAYNLTEKTLTFYSNEAVRDKFRKYVDIYQPPESLANYTFNIFKPFETVAVGNYLVTPLPADHAYDEDAYVFIVREGNKALYYLHDTGILPDKALNYLRRNPVKADFISFDCCFGGIPGTTIGHLGLDTDIVLRDMLKDIGVCDEHTLYCINHFSHNGGLIYDEIAPIAEKEGFLTSYDGMIAEF